MENKIAIKTTAGILETMFVTPAVYLICICGLMNKGHPCTLKSLDKWLILHLY